MPMPEETFVPVYTPQHTAYYAPGFGSATPGAPGQPTAPAEEEDEDEAGPKPSQSSTAVRTPTSPLAGVNTGGGASGEGSPYGGQTTPGSPGVVNRDTDSYRRGSADLTAENIAKAIGFGATLSGTSPLSIAAAEGIEAATGYDTGFGVPDFSGYVGPNQPGAANIKAGQATLAEQQAADRSAAGRGGPTGGLGQHENRGGPGGFGGGPAGGGDKIGDLGGGDSSVDPGIGGSQGGQGGFFKRGGTVKPHPYAAGGTVRGGGDGSGGPPRPQATRRPEMVQPPTRGAGPIDAGPGVTSVKPVKAPSPYGGIKRYAGGGAVMGDPSNPTQDERYTAPASIPDDGVVDNQIIATDEGEFVLRRDAAVQYPSEILEILNDPDLADDAALVLMEYFQITPSTEQDLDPTSGNAVRPPAPGMGGGMRPRSPLGRMG